MTRRRASFSRAIELRPNYPEAHYNLANTLKELEKTDEAIAGYKRAIELRPDLVQAYNNLGMILLSLKRHEKAIEAFGKAVDLQPGYATAHNNLGSALHEIGRQEQALQSFERAIRLKNDYAGAYNNRGVVLQELGRLEAALASFRQAIQINNDFGEALEQLERDPARPGPAARTGGGVPMAHRPPQRQRRGAQLPGAALLELGQLDDAIAACSRAIALKPDMSEAHNNLGNARRDQGHLDEAIACYRQALKLKPDVPCHSQQSRLHHSFSSRLRFGARSWKKTGTGPGSTKSRCSAGRSHDPTTARRIGR